MLKEIKAMGSHDNLYQSIGDHMLPDIKAMGITCYQTSKLLRLHDNRADIHQTSKLWNLHANRDQS